MAEKTRSIRLTRCSTAVTALAAVLSVAGAAGVAGGQAQLESRAGLSDAQVVRVVTAVFEAMARDLLTPGHTNAALAEATATMAGGSANPPLRYADRTIEAHVPPLAERLLDLPPPSC